MSEKRSGIIVVAGVIEENGKILIGQRRRQSRHGMKWEFPGGKVEQGESLRHALKRELAEELSIDATVGEEIIRYEHTYPRRKPILLVFYRIQDYRGTPVNRVFEEIRWESAENLWAYDFLDGDFDFIRRLRRGDFRKRAANF